MAKLLGITDDTSTCECCGKTNLKRVVVIELDSGDIVRYGTDCAGKTLFRKPADKANLSSMVELKQFADKWMAKYGAEGVAKWIGMKLGYSARVSDNQLQVWLGQWVAIS